MSNLTAEKQHLAGLLEAIQRCAFFLDAAQSRMPNPLAPEWLESHKKDLDVFANLSTVNERFAKLQDTLGSAMRHASSLAGERTDTFLRVLAFYEKIGVIGPVETWQEIRSFRNSSAHDYETEYGAIADHFNTLRSLTPELLVAARKFTEFCATQLGTRAFPGEFGNEFLAVAKQ